MTTLAALLRMRGLDPASLLALKTTLHPDDVSTDFRDIDDIVRADALAIYDRMQDGPRIPHDARVMSFVTLADDGVRLYAYRRFLMRRPGTAPGDIVYHYDAAHLLHAFISRAANPVFYDAIDEPGLDDLIDKLVIRWPIGETMLGADDERFVVVSGS